MSISTEKTVREVALRYLEKVFNVKKHQDVLHLVLTHAAWEVFFENVILEVEKLRKQGKKEYYVIAYIAARTHKFMDRFLDILEEKAGTQAMIEAELIKPT